MPAFSGKQHIEVQNLHTQVLFYFETVEILQFNLILSENDTNAFICFIVVRNSPDT